MSIDAKRTWAGAAFVALLALSVFWPSPVVSTNQLWLHERIAVDDLSFLGREAPSWDVVYWCLAGLFALVLLRPSDERLPFATAWEQLRATRIRIGKRDLVGAVVAVVVVALTW